MPSQPPIPPKDDVDEAQIDALEGPLFAPSFDGGAGADFGEDDDAEWAPEGARRGLTMRHPSLLLVLLAGAIFLFVGNLPRALDILEADDPADFGAISDRPHLEFENDPTLPDLTHDRYGKLEGVVQLPSILATGDKVDGEFDPYKANVGRKFYVKLDGAKVFAILDASRKEVVDFRERQRSLVGFQVNTTGRMVDPDVEPGYAGTARTLRLKYSIAETTPVRLFDTTYDPMSRWPYVLICGLMLFTALLALYGLLRVLLAGRKRA